MTLEQSEKLVELVEQIANHTAGVGLGIIVMCFILAFKRMH